jgi:hypothetical protein
MLIGRDGDAGMDSVEVAHKQTGTGRKNLHRRVHARFLMPLTPWPFQAVQTLKSFFSSTFRKVPLHAAADPSFFIIRP